MQIHLKEKSWNWQAHTIALLELWSSDLMFRLEIQTWCSDLKFRLDVQTWVQTWESSTQDWRLKILQGSSWRIFHPGLKIEDWRFSRALAVESSIQDWRLKILQDPSWIIFNPGENLSYWILSLGLKILQEESWRIFNLQSSIHDWRFPNKNPGESSTFNPGLKIPQQEPRRIFNLQSWIEDFPTRVLENLQSSILDWRFSKKSPGGDAWRWGNATGWGHWAEPGSWAKVASAPKAWDWILSVLFNLHSEAIHAAWRNKKVCSSEGMWGIWNSSIRRSGASSVAWKQALRCLALCLGQR